MPIFGMATTNAKAALIVLYYLQFCETQYKKNKLFA